MTFAIRMSLSSRKLLSFFHFFTRICTAPNGTLRIKTTHNSMSPKRDFKFTKFRNLWNLPPPGWPFASVFSPFFSLPKVLWRQEHVPSDWKMHFKTTRSQNLLFVYMSKRARKAESFLYIIWTILISRVGVPQKRKLKNTGTKNNVLFKSHFVFVTSLGDVQI